MKHYLKIIIVIMIVTGGVFMANEYGGCSDLKYSKYSSEDSELNILMDYISDWRYQEHRGSYNSYAQVQFYGAVKDNFAPSIVITVEPDSKVTFQPLSIEGLVDDLVKKRMALDDAQVVSKTDTELLSYPAVDLTLTYNKPNQLRSLDAKPIAFKERIVVFQRNNKFYTIRYLNPQKVYEEFEQAFLHGIDSFNVKE